MIALAALTGSAGLPGAARVARAGPISAFSLPEVDSEDLRKAGEAARTGDAATALRHLREVVRKDAALPPAQVLLARIQLGGNRANDGRRTLEVAAGETPDHPEVYLTLGNLALVDGRLTEAELAYKHVEKLLAEARMPPEARKRILMTLHMGRTAVAEAKSDWKAATDQLRGWLALDPKNGQARGGLGRNLFRTGKREDALSELRKAHADDKTQELPELALARLHAQADEQKVAEEWFRKALVADPAAHAPPLVYGVWLMEQKRLTEAKVEAEKADRLAKDNVEPKRLRGMLARLLEDAKEAEFCFDAVVRDRPGDLPATIQLIQVLCDSKDDAKRRRGLQLAETTARRMSDNLEVLGTLGYAYLSVGRTADAAQVMQRVAQGAPGGRLPTDLAYFMGEAFYQLGRLEPARQIFRSCADAPGLFVYRKAAKERLAQLEAGGAGGGRLTP